MNKADTGQR